MAGRDVLVVTHPPFEGGVPAKARILCTHLRDQGHRVTVAWYATFHHDPGLSVPAWHLLSGRRPGTRRQPCFGDFPGVAVGCRFPELEAPYYLGSSRWRALVARHNRHIAVGGPPLVAHPLVAAGVPALLWCASDVHADRRDRVARMSPVRRAVHDAVTMPWLAGMERRVLAAVPRVLGVSAYTLDRLRAHGCPPERAALLHIPTDCTLYTPPTAPAPPGVLGFAARFEDPRKNLGLLLDAVALIKRDGMPVRLRLAGTDPSPATRAAVARLGLDAEVEFVGELPAAALPDFYRSLDVFVLPSHQEGLCISGVEALASGVPVVSTRCGGPEDYVRDGESGRLCDFTARSLADAVAGVVGDRGARAALSSAGRALAEREFSHAAFAAGLARSWRAVWGEAP